MRLQADQHLVAAAEALHLGILEASHRQLLAYLVDIGRLVETGFDHGTAGELQRVGLLAETLGADNHQRNQNTANISHGTKWRQRTEVDLGVVPG